MSFRGADRQNLLPLDGARLLTYATYLAYKHESGLTDLIQLSARKQIVFPKHVNIFLKFDYSYLDCVHSFNQRNAHKDYFSYNHPLSSQHLQYVLSHLVNS